MESEPTMKRVSRAMLWCLSAICLGLAGCSSSGKLEVAFVSNNAADFWKIAEAGCRKAEADLGIKVNVRMPPNGTAAEQKEYIDTLLSQGVKGIAISVIDPKNQSDFLAKVAKRTNLITQDNDAPASGRLCYIGTDNYQAGLATGELVKEALPDGGVIGIFVGQIEPLNAQQRRNGVLDALAGERVAEARGGAPGQYGKYRLVNVYVDGVNEKIAKEKAQDFLSETQKEPKVCMVGLWAYNPPAMLSAYEKYTGENKPGIRLVGFDEHADTLRGIAEGTIVGTVVQDPFKFGYESARVLAAVARGDRSVLPADGLLHVPHRVVTKAGGPGRIAVDQFQAELARLLGKAP
jgi:ribose transport system substrate-binding protein